MLNRNSSWKSVLVSCCLLLLTIHPAHAQTAPAPVTPLEKPAAKPIPPSKPAPKPHPPTSTKLPAQPKTTNSATNTAATKTPAPGTQATAPPATATSAKTSPHSNPSTPSHHVPQTAAPNYGNTPVRTDPTAFLNNLLPHPVAETPQVVAPGNTPAENAAEANLANATASLANATATVANAATATVANVANSVANATPSRAAVGSALTQPLNAAGSSSVFRGVIAPQGTGDFRWEDYTLTAYSCYRSGSRVLCDFDITKEQGAEASANMFGNVALVDDGGRITHRHDAYYLATDGKRMPNAYLSTTPVRFIMEFDDATPSNSISLVDGNQRIQNISVAAAPQ
jgi:hypothetical protein